MPYEIRIPRLGWSMEEGVFVGWLKQPGETVAVGEALFELESDKALQQIESLDAGTLFVPADAPVTGATVAVGTLLGYLLAEGESRPSAPRPKSPNGPADENQSSVAVASRSAPAGPAARRLARALHVDLASVVGSGKHGRITCEDVEGFAGANRASPRTDARPSTVRCVATPRARRVAAELAIDWRSLRGTGRGGRIRESDVRSAAAQATDFRAPDGTRPRPLSPRRKAIVDRLRLSRQRTIPVTLTATADATNLVAFRERCRSSGKDVVPAYTDIVAKLVAETLLRHPQMAVRWDASGAELIAIEPEAVHVAVAVDTPDGLLAPVVRDVASKSVFAIAHESQALIDRARRGRLAAAEMQGGAITITNLGRYRIDAFTPVINYPEIAILGLGAIRTMPMATRDGRIEPRQGITLSLTFDHAAVDGAPAAAFLHDVAVALEGVVS